MCRGRIISSEMHHEGSPLWSYHGLLSFCPFLPVVLQVLGHPVHLGPLVIPAKTESEVEELKKTVQFFSSSKEDVSLSPHQEKKVFFFMEAVTERESASPQGSLQNKSKAEYKQSSQMHNLAGSHHFKSP